MNKGAFTFIELLIAVSIFAVVAIALYSTFFAGIMVWKRSGEGGGLYQDVKFTFDYINRDLKNAVTYTTDEESALVFSGTASEVSFVTLEPSFLENGMAGRELISVSYGLEEEEGQLTRRAAGISLGLDTEKAEKEILLKGVEDFKFEYCYDSGDEDEPYLWKEEWEHEGMKVPRGIRLSFLIKSEKGGKGASEFSKIIFVPTGVLGEKEIGL